MTNIDRRRLLSALGATPLCAAAVPSMLSVDVQARAENQTRRHINATELKEWCCLIVRQPTVAATDERPNVDFWSRQYSEVDYAKYLPPEIPRGLVYYDSCNPKEFNNETALAYLDSLPERYGILFRPNERRSWSAFWGREYFLSARIADCEWSSCNTALIDLDSLGPDPNEPEWAEILPAFAGTYRHIIGFCSLPHRGLRQTKARFDSIFFKRYFENAVSQCDAVIVTSHALVEADPGISPHASAEELVGRLMSHLGCALLTPAVLERIVGRTRTSRS